MRSERLVSVFHMGQGENIGTKDARTRDAVAPLRLSDLDAPQRRRALLRTGATIALAWVLIGTAFYVLPFGHQSSLRMALRLGADIALIGAVFAWQIWRIKVGELPELRAFEALGIVVGLFLALFSGIYLAMANGNQATFTQALDHTRALYFTISVFSTVGFGDITPRTDPARLVVAAQMLLDLVIIGLVVRVLLSAAKSRITPAAPSGGAEP
jgi:voltage-gated potassium channel